MLNQFVKNVQENCLIDAEKPILLGVSGGVDSLCLLDCFARLGFKLLVAHVDHSLREQSSAEAQYVAKLAAERGLPFFTERVDVRGYASANGLSIEAAARVLRYRFLFQEARRAGTQAVAVGHHAADQVETILLHLLRGAGTAGLQGMHWRLLPNPWSQGIPLVRPLLSFEKSALVAYCQENGLQPVEDESNQDVGYTRNRLRLEVLPMLESIQPGLRQALLRLAAIAQDEQSVLQTLVEAGWRNCQAEAGSGWVCLHRSAFICQATAIQRLILRKALSILRPGVADLDFALVERSLEWLRSASCICQVDLAAGLRLRVEGECFWLAEWSADLPTQNWPQVDAEHDGMVIPLPGGIELGHGWRLETSLAPFEHAMLEQAQGPPVFQAWLDADVVEDELRLRRRWPGARYAPLGLGGKSQKISDWMINIHLPQRARAAWPLLCQEQTVLWAVGGPPAYSACLRETTRQVVRVRLVKD